MSVKHVICINFVHFKFGFNWSLTLFISFKYCKKKKNFKNKKLESVITGNGRSFVSRLFERVCKWYAILLIKK